MEFEVSGEALQLPNIAEVSRKLECSILSKRMIEKSIQMGNSIQAPVLSAPCLTAINAILGSSGHYDQALEAAAGIRLDSLYAIVTNDTIDNAFRTGNTSEKFLKEASDLASRIEVPILKAQAYHTLSQAFESKGDGTEARKCFSIAVGAATKNFDVSLQSYQEKEYLSEHDYKQFEEDTLSKIINDSVSKGYIEEGCQVVLHLTSTPLGAEKLGQMIQDRLIDRSTAEKLSQELVALSSQSDEDNDPKKVAIDILTTQISPTELEHQLDEIDLNVKDAVKTILDDASKNGDPAGTVNQALVEAAKIHSSRDKALAFANIAIFQSRKGIDPGDSIKLALAAAPSGGRSVDRAEVLKQVVTALVDADKPTEAKGFAEQIFTPYLKEQALKYIENGPYVPQDSDSEVLIEDIADTAVEPKKDALAKKAKSSYQQMIQNFKDKISDGKLKDLFNELVNEKVDTTGEELRSEYTVAEDLAELAIVAEQMGYSSEEIKQLPEETVKEVLKRSNNHNVLEALGYFGRVDPNALPEDIRKQVGISIIAGITEKNRQEGETQTNRDLLNQIRAVTLGNEEEMPKIKAFVEGMVSTQDYRSASNMLLGMIDQIRNRPAPEGSRQEGITQAQMTRLLKGLIEIDNPRGKTLATKLFTEKIAPEYQEYIAKKLFEANYWGHDLGEYLQGQLSTAEDQSGRDQIKSEQYKVLSALINEFGLTPDMTAYELLEKPGVIKEDTLEGRIEQLKLRVKDFEGKNRDELLELFGNDESNRKIYYVTQVGRYLYSVVNDYTYDKFKAVTDRVASLPIHEPTLNRFQALLMESGMGEQEAAGIIDKMVSGAPLTKGEQSSFRFSTTVEYGSRREIALQKLQDVWKEELKSLLIARAGGQIPNNMLECLDVLNNQEMVDAGKIKLSSIWKSLRLDQDKITQEDIQTIVKDFRNRLKGVYASQNSKENFERLRAFSDIEVIREYLTITEILPSIDTPVMNEWLTHLSEVFTDLNSAGSVKPKTSDKELELTFLDKNTDFVRALRFADSAQCCLNASEANFNERTYEYVTRLNKDPLSFILDLKEAGANEIVGFVFGRFGINPESSKPVIMLNGIYSQLKGGTVADNILRIIEDQMGSLIKPESIVLASKFGGMVAQPTGYETVNGIRLEAIRALKSPYGDRAEDSTYDDIGTVANGQFPFSGYRKALSLPA